MIYAGSRTWHLIKLIRQGAMITYGSCWVGEACCCRSINVKVCPTSCTELQYTSYSEGATIPCAFLTQHCSDGVALGNTGSMYSPCLVYYNNNHSRFLYGKPLFTDFK
jgi:hypothetical protein